MKNNTKYKIKVTTEYEFGLEGFRWYMNRLKRSPKTYNSAVKSMKSGKQSSFKDFYRDDMVKTTYEVEIPECT